MYYYPGYKWRPTHQHGQDVLTIEGLELDECPVSYLTPKSVELVACIAAANQIREATGQHPWPPVNTWPVRLVDACKTIAIEDIKISNARIESRSE